MADPAMAAQNLRRLSESGVQLAVDDFGTGYSSLAYLQQFPIDFLKVDGCFVNQMLERSDAGLVDAIVQLTHTLGLTPIAEGSSSSQVERLQAMGCDLGQGYHLDRPLDATTISRRIIANRGTHVAPPRSDLLKIAISARKW